MENVKKNATHILKCYLKGLAPLNEGPFLFCLIDLSSLEIIGIQTII
jgi:hypothetical protein